MNTGWEIDLSGTGIKTRNFSWYTSFNITIPRNKLVSYSELATSSYTNKYAIGYPLNILKLYHYVKTDPNTGIYQFEKQSDHSVTTDPKNPDDYIVKDMSVRYYGGLLNSFKYKGFALDVFFQFVKEPALNYFTQFSVPGLRENQPTYILDRWQQPGDIKNTQKYTQTFSTVYNAWNNNQQSDYAVTDGSFIRLKNLSLSWQLPPALLQKMKINQLRFFVHAQNLLTITSYKGFDPESNGLLPPLKVFTAGFHCTF